MRIDSSNSNAKQTTKTIENKYWNTHTSYSNDNQKQNNDNNKKQIIEKQSKQIAKNCTEEKENNNIIRLFNPNANGIDLQA